MARKDCDEMQEWLADLALDIAKLFNIKELDPLKDKLNETLKENKFKDFTFEREHIAEAVEAFARPKPKKAEVEMRKAITAIIRESREDVKLNKEIKEILRQLDTGELKLATKKQRKKAVQAIKLLRVQRKSLAKERNARIKINELNRKIAEKDYSEKKITRKERDQRIELLKKELSTLKKIESLDAEIARLSLEPTGIASLQSKETKRREVDKRIKERKEIIRDFEETFNLKKEIELLEQRDKAGDFSTPEKKPGKEDKENIKALKDKRSRLVRERGLKKDIEIGRKRLAEGELSESGEIKLNKEISESIQELVKLKSDVDKEIKLRRNIEILESELQTDVFSKKRSFEEKETSKMLKHLAKKESDLKRRRVERRKEIELERKILEKDFSSNKISKEQKSNRLELLQKELATLKKLDQLDKKIATLTKSPTSEVPVEPLSFKQQKELDFRIKERNEILKEFARKGSLEAQIREFKRRLKERDFERPENKKKSEIDEHLEDLIFERDQIKAQFESQLRLLKPKDWIDKSVEISGFMRLLGPNFDLVPVFRQGAKLFASNPILTGKNAWLGTKAIFSDKALRQAQRRLQNNPFAKEAKIAKLEFTEFDGELTAREEAFRVSLIDRIPLVNRSGRGYTAFLNMVRMDVFNSMLNTGFEGMATTPELLALGKFINAATGRGNLGRFKGTELAGNLIFFSYRNQIGNLQYMAGGLKSLADVGEITAKTIIGKKNTIENVRIKKAIAKQYLRYLVFNATLTGMLNTFQDPLGIEMEFNTKSTDFGKIKDKESELRIEYLGGVSSYLSMISIMFSGQKKNLKTGEIENLSNYQRWLKSTQFLRYKLSPGAAFGVNLLTQTNPMLRDWSFTGELDAVTTPFILADVIESFKATNPSKAALYSFFGLLGASMGIYKDKDDPRFGTASFVIKQLGKMDVITKEQEKAFLNYPATPKETSLFD